MKQSAPVRYVLPILTLGLLAACDSGTSLPGTPVTALTDSGAGSLRQAIADAGAGDTLRMTGSGTVTLASPLVTDKNLTILAGGVTFDAGGTGRVLEVPEGVTVTITGGTLTGGLGQAITARALQAVDLGILSRPTSGKLQAQGTAQPTWGGVILNRGDLTLDGVTVTGGKASLGGGIANLQDATLTLKGTTQVTGNEATDLPDAAEGVNYGEGGGINNAGMLIMQGGSVSGNRAPYVAGGIRNTRTGTLDLQSGTVNDNACTYPFSGDATKGYSGCAGGGILSTGTMKMSGGSVSNNTATYFGGGIAAQRTCADTTCTAYNYGTFSMSGGTVEGNKTTGTADNGGGGLWLRAKSSMSGGTIRANSSQNGGGVQNWHELSVTGGTIENNTASQNGGGIGNSIPKDAGVRFTFGGSATVQNNTAGNTGGGFTLFGYSQGEMTGGTVSGNKVTGTTDGGGGVRVGGTSSLTISGGEIRGNSALRGGGGLLIGGAVTMTGGSISGNSVTGTDNSQGKGGGVQLYSNSSFEASGGSISSNTASLKGGGVSVGGSYVNDQGVTVPAAQFTLSGAKIENNTARKNGGGIQQDGLMTMTSGSVSGNTTGGLATGEGWGGGINLNPNAQLIATGGTITGNVAYVHGGGVMVGGSYVDSKGVTVPSAKFDMNGLTISGNQARAGGGVGSCGAFTLQGGQITGNKTTEAGGGVRNFRCAGVSFTQTGGDVSGNTPDQIVTDQ